MAIGGGESSTTFSKLKVVTTGMDGGARLDAVAGSGVRALVDQV